MWRLLGTAAQLHTRQLVGSIELRQPQRGFHDIRVSDGQLADARLLQLQLPGGSTNEELRDSWVRANDLVAVYAATDHRASQPEIYWRALSGPDENGLELIVSVQTGVLDDHPAIEVASELPAGDAWWLPTPGQPALADRILPSKSARAIGEADGAGLCVVQLSNLVSYVEMVFPSDFSRIELAWSGDRIRLHTSLFPDRLEKGVIRRGRIRGCFVPTESAFDTAGTLYGAFAKSDPPLTT